MREAIRYQRAQAVPGDHGPLDWRVEIAGVRMTLPELVFVVGMTLQAEDRYRGRDDLGRRFLWTFLDAVSRKFTPEEITDVARRCAEACGDV